jgi:hypothetical protein
MVPGVSEKYKMHEQINSFARAMCTFDKNIPKIARDMDQLGKLLMFLVVEGDIHLLHNPLL